MARMIAIIAITLMFTLLGLGVAYIAVQNLPIEAHRGGKDKDMVTLLSVLPPLFGTVLGFGVGLVAALFAKKTGS